MAAEALDGARFVVGTAVLARWWKAAFNVDAIHRRPDNDLTRFIGLAQIVGGVVSAAIVSTSLDVMPLAAARGDEFGAVVWGIYAITLLANAAILAKDLRWFYYNVDNRLARFHQERSSRATRQKITGETEQARKSNANIEGVQTRHGRLTRNQAGPGDSGRVTPLRSFGRIPSSANGSERRIEGHKVKPSRG